MHAGRSRGPLTCGVNLPRGAVPFRSGEGEASDKGTRIGLNRNLGTVTANENDQDWIEARQKESSRTMRASMSPRSSSPMKPSRLKRKYPRRKMSPWKELKMMIVSKRPCLMSLRLGMRTKLALCAGVSKSAGYGHPLRPRAERQPHRHGIASV